jgi:predicted GH43/DUF377 family glycosyl hydrolase
MFKEGRRLISVSFILATLLVSTVAVTAIEPEPIVSLADLHFAAPGLELLPAGSPVEGDTVRIVGHVQASGTQAWTKAGVVLDRGSPGEPDSHELGAPSVIYDGGEHKMWYAGTTGSMTGSILYATSPDGASWTKHGAVLAPGSSPENVNVHYPCVMKDGVTYKMWYSGFDGSHYRIFYATSADGLTWSRQGLVLNLGPPGSYDDNFAYGPFVLKEGSAYRMWYSGSDGANVRLLYATSPDGRGWTKQGVNLNLGPPGSLENVHVSPSYILVEGGGYHMWYRGSDGTNDRIFYATSSDGLSWRRRGVVVDVGPPGSTDAVHILLQSVLHLPGMPYQIWYTGRGQSTMYDRIHYAYMTSVPMPVSAEVEFYLDAISPGNSMGVTIAQIGILHDSTATLNWIAGPPGWHTIYAVIDPLGGIPETDEGNNTASVDVFVRAPLPDYIPAQPRPVSPVKTGLTLPLQLSLQVANIGGVNVTADATLAICDESGTPFASFTIPSLDSGKVSARFTAAWTSPAVPGTHLVSADVDYYDNVAEWDETNNVYTWTIDVVAGPVTSLSVGSPSHVSPALVMYVKSSTPLDLSVLDQGGSGINHTWYRTDNLTWIDYSAPFFLSGEGDHYVEWYSEDNVGNVENVSRRVLRVDDTPPATALSIGEPKYTLGGNFVTSFTPLALHADDGGVMPVGTDYTEYRVEGGNWNTYSSPLFLTTEGIHTLEFHSYDLLANPEPVHSIQVVVDDTPPTTMVGVGEPEYQAADLYVTSSTGINLTSTDGGAIPVGLGRTEYRVDGGGWFIYAHDITLSGADGPRTIQYRSVDLLGNIEIVRSIRVVLDNTPPTTTISPAAGPFAADMWFNLTTTDSGCGVAAMEYKIDSEQWRFYEGNFTVQTGLHTIWFKSTDNLGNRETPKSLEVDIEAERPPDIAVGTNYKPMVATVFTVALLVAGFWSSRGRPWKNRKDRVAMLQAFCAYSLPFATAETVTGLLSLATGVLSIPPVLGLGTAVDVSILSIGFAVAMLNVAGRKQKGPPPGSQDSIG